MKFKPGDLVVVTWPKRPNAIDQHIGVPNPHTPEMEGRVDKIFHWNAGSETPLYTVCFKGGYPSVWECSPRWMRHTGGPW